MKNIIIGMVLAVLLIAIGVGGYIAYNSYANQGHNHSDSYTSSHHNSHGQDDAQSMGSSPEIDVLSKDFSENFMNSDVRNEFYGLELGMSRADIEKKFGSSEGSIAAGQSNAEKYGNLAVRYNADDEADHIFVAPDNVKKVNLQIFMVHQL